MNYNYIPSLEFSNSVLTRADKLPRYEFLLSADFRGAFVDSELSKSFCDDFKNLSSFFLKEDLETISIKRDYLRFKNHAVLITNKANKIQWASSNLSSMTGYEVEDVINQTPRLFQGEKTETEKLKKLAASLSCEKKYETILTNYKKDGETYLCDIKIIPLRNRISQEVTHYLAFEKGMNVESIRK